MFQIQVQIYNKLYKKAKKIYKKLYKNVVYLNINVLLYGKKRRIIKFCIKFYRKI